MALICISDYMLDRLGREFEMENSLEKARCGQTLAAGARYHEGLAGTWTAGYAKRGFRKRLEVIVRELGSMVLPGSHWLDAGCGSGILTRVLNELGASGEAIDGSPGMIRRAREEQNRIDPAGAFSFGVVETIERLEFEDANFDGVLCSSVIEYVEAPEQALQELVRVLKPGGHLFLSVANYHSLIRHVQSMLRRAHITRRYAYLDTSRTTYTRQGIVTVLERLGMQVDKVAFFDPTLPAATFWMLPASLILVRAVKKS